MHKRIKDKHVTVMGLGRFGGGAGVVRWLNEQGANVTLTDLQDAETLAGPLAALGDLTGDAALTLRLGGHDERDFTGADLVVANPAVPRPWENPYLIAAQNAGVPITTEIRLSLERLDRNRLIGVTGSAGKSTTTAMIHHILQRILTPPARPWLGGNIGGSLLPDLERIGPEDWVTVELSSAQLYWLGADVGYPGAPAIAPHVAVLTNIAPNHLDWHGSLEHYAKCKLSMFTNQREADHRVRGADFEEQRRAVPLRLRGAHNQRNALTAVTAVLRATGALPQDTVPHLADFGGLPHRLELIAERDGRAFYNDSKSTTPEATLLAISSFKKPSTVHLIVGGYDKGVDLGAIAAEASRLGGLYAIGTTAAAIVEAAGVDRAIECKTLDRAVAHALDQMQDGHVLLMSPGCASWDQFTNFEARGDSFRELVGGDGG